MVEWGNAWTVIRLNKLVSVSDLGDAAVVGATVSEPQIYFQLYIPLYFAVGSCNTLSNDFCLIDILNYKHRLRKINLALIVRNFDCCAMCCVFSMEAQMGCRDNSQPAISVPMVSAGIHASIPNGVIKSVHLVIRAEYGH